MKVLRHKPRRTAGPQIQRLPGTGRPAPEVKFRAGLASESKEPIRSSDDTEATSIGMLVCARSEHQGKANYKYCCQSHLVAVVELDVTCQRRAETKCLSSLEEALAISALPVTRSDEQHDKNNRIDGQARPGKATYFR